MEEIKIKDYFNMIFDDYHRLVAIQSIGDERELIDAIRSQNCELKRLEQENECLKEKLIIAQNSDNKTMEILKENAELKEKINTYNCSSNCYKYIEANKYRKALEEIREMTKAVRYFPQERFVLIRAKINEVLESEEE